MKHTNLENNHLYNTVVLVLHGGGCACEHFGLTQNVCGMQLIIGRVKMFTMEQIQLLVLGFVEVCDVI